MTATKATTKATNNIPVDDARDDELPDLGDPADGPARMKALLDERPAAKARYEAATEEIDRHQATLARVRQARRLTQQTVAELLDMDQSEVSRLEHRTDMMVSTLRRFIQATGGELRFVATYPGESDVDLVIGVDDRMFVLQAKTAPAVKRLPGP